LFNCLQLAEPVLRTRDSFGAALSQKAGAGAQTTCGGPEATPSQETRAGATGTHAGPGAAPSQGAGAGALGHVGTRTALSFVLTWSLYAGVPGPQGTDSSDELI
jgi:hypothetical protein